MLEAILCKQRSVSYTHLYLKHVIDITLGKDADTRVMHTHSLSCLLYTSFGKTEISLADILKKQITLPTKASLKRPTIILHYTPMVNLHVKYMEYIDGCLLYTSTMGLGDTYTLKLAGAKNPVWKSSNGKIAIVKNGKVIARKSGKATITATYKGKSYKCTVLVKAPKISSAKFSMTVGTKKQVRVLNTINRVVWFTSNKSIAVVDKKGLVTARKAGKVKIVGKLHGKNYTSVITVKKSAAKPVTLSKKSAKVLDVYKRQRWMTALHLVLQQRSILGLAKN